MDIQKNSHLTINNCAASIGLATAGDTAYLRSRLSEMRDKTMNEMVIRREDPLAISDSTKN